MKMMKKLKFWSRKKKKKKAFCIDDSPPLPPPPTFHSQRYQYYYYPIEPSAPPLPISSSSSSSSSWVEYDHHIHETISFTSSTQAQVPVYPPPQDIHRVPEISAHDPVPSASDESASYQQHTVQNPVYGVPIVSQEAKTESSGGAFGCVFTIGAHLFRCFFPCFHIQEVNRHGFLHSSSHHDLKKLL
ncbi:OLC1v1038844C1 [Oldenlandia corymbosa var. corymbosa]|uniref:OLC1v1038844C1 n=1 Tax=Oldenlandia corymbosa var. corymbosa TaxID=529605 RepID=A0AAV1D0Z4_OLDCO|nr:OLC1v1038844C1 [Oldenlandia corymbosa var. corymbosa]